MPHDQKRSSPRNRTLRGGTIIFHNGISTMKCRIRDESASGFQLSLENVQGVPDEFYLVIDFEPDRIPCQVRWRKVGRIGIKRLQSVSAAGAAPALPKSMDPASLMAEALRQKSEEMQAALGGRLPRKSLLLKRPLAG